ncbi:MAG: hypothetical protein NC337_01995 [Roseburia sp.]|nr:hypothetical protein [Roseburia sp.]
MTFDEYKRKNINTRVRITYARTCEKRLNPWEISHFISRITTYMYKVEALNTIAAAINSGVRKKDIFVLDRAYRLNENYTGCAELDLNRALNRLYSMGSPEAMEPNQDLTELKLLFGLFYDVSQTLGACRAARISGRERVEAYRCLTRRGFLAAVEAVGEMAALRLRGREDLSLKNALDKLDSKCETAAEEYKRFLSDQERFAVVEEKLNAGNSEKLSAQEEQIARRYYEKFYQMITDSARPIVGIYDPQYSTMRLLCADHFDASLNKNTKIDLKSITQNSPIMGEIEAGCQILALREEEKRKKELFELERENLMQEKKNARLKEENLMLERDNLMLERKKQQTELSIVSLEKQQKQIETVNSALETLRRINELADDEESRGVKELAESFAKQQLCGVYAKVQKGYSDTLYQNGFRETETRIIDMKV